MKIKDTQRPFRLWDAQRKKHVTGKRFSHPRRALNNAISELQWSPIGTALEVYDVRTGLHLGTYVRKVGYIDVWKRRVTED